MANVKPTIPTKKKKTTGIEKGPSRSKSSPAKKDPFGSARELDKFNQGRKKRFGAK